MAKWRVEVTETVSTTYVVEVDCDSDKEAENMALDLITNNSDDPDFLGVTIIDESLVGRRFISDVI